MRHVELPLVALLLLIALAARCIALNADPPAWLSYSAGIYSDEGIYSNAARMLVIDYQREPGDFHSAVIAPLQFHMLVAVFRRFGASLRIVRLVAIAFSAGSLLAFWAALRVSHGRSIALAGLTLLSASAPFVLYNRLGLLEMPALFWLMLGLLFMTMAASDEAPAQRADFALSFVSGLFIGLAVAWKGTFLVGAAPLLAYAVWKRGRVGAAAAAGAICSLGVYVLKFYLPHQAEMSQAAHFYLWRQYLPHTLSGVRYDILRGLFTGANDGVLPYLLRHAPALLILAICALIPTARHKSDRCLWLWAAVPTAACLFLNYTPSRYFLIFWPALAALAACALVRLSRRKAVTGLALAACVAIDAVLLCSTYIERTYTIYNGNVILAKSLPAETWVAGQFAPELCLNDRLRAVYVQSGLANTNPSFLTSIPITDILATRTVSPEDDPWRADRGEFIAGPGGLYDLPIGRRYIVNVYANKAALP